MKNMSKKELWQATLALLNAAGSNARGEDKNSVNLNQIAFERTKIRSNPVGLGKHR